MKRVLGQYAEAKKLKNMLSDISVRSCYRTYSSEWQKLCRKRTGDENVNTEQKHHKMLMQESNFSYE